MLPELWQIEEYRGAIRKLATKLANPRDFADAVALLDSLKVRGTQMAPPQVEIAWRRII